MHLTRLAVGLIFFVSTFFSAVNLLTDSWAIFSLKWKQGGGRREEEKKGEEKRKEERGRGQVKQKSKCCWINQLAVWKYKEWFSVLFITKFKLCKGDSSGLSKVNSLHWLRGSPRCLWEVCAFATNAGVSDLRNTRWIHCTLRAHFKALWLVIHSVGKMKTILKTEILEKHMKTTNIKIHQFTLRKWKDNPHRMGKIFVNHTSDKGLAFRIHEWLLQVK